MKLFPGSSRRSLCRAVLILMLSLVGLASLHITSAASPREVAVAIPIQTETDPSRATAQDIRVCLVTSRKHPGKYVLPKGGIEKGEDSRQAASREMWEEAGLVPIPSPGDSISKTPSNMLKVDDHKPHKESTSPDPHDQDFVPRATYVGHEILVSHVDGVKEDWPERHERSRKWFSPDEAAQEIAWRNDIATIFSRWRSGLPSSSSPLKSHSEL